MITKQDIDGMFDQLGEVQNTGCKRVLYDAVMQLQAEVKKAEKPMNDNRIIEGDTVHVDFNCIRYTLISKGTVLRVPTATGDSWIIEDNTDGTVYHISEPCTICKAGGAG